MPGFRHRHQAGHPLLFRQYSHQRSSRAGTGTPMRRRRCVHRVGAMWESIEGSSVPSRKSRACTPALATMMSLLIRTSLSLAREASLPALCHSLQAVVLVLLHSPQRVQVPVTYNHTGISILTMHCVVSCPRRRLPRRPRLWLRRRMVLMDLGLE